MDSELELLLKNYQPTEKTIQLIRSVRTILVVGISGVGKNTVIGELLKTDKYHFIVSHNTRPPRKNQGVMEVDGREYHFIDFNEAKRKLEAKEYFEVNLYDNNIYGTATSEFEEALKDGKIALGDVDVNGVAQYMSVASEMVRPIFLLPPDFDTWMKRFKSRYEGQIGESSLSRRMHTAKQEIEHVLSQSYFSIVVNDVLEDTVTQVQAIASGEPQSDAAWRHGSDVAHHLIEEIDRAL